MCQGITVKLRGLVHTLLLPVLIAPLMSPVPGMVPSVLAEDIAGAGDGSVTPLMDRWAADYFLARGLAISYQQLGTDGGFAQLRSGVVDFAIVSGPVGIKRCATFCLRIPLVMGAVVIVANVPDVDSGAIVLSGELLGQIYTGKIRTWNDPAVRALNPGLLLPDMPIVVVHRSDGAGDTWVFTKWLDRVSPDWRHVGEGSIVSWPLGRAAKGEQGMNKLLREMPGAIGYIRLVNARLFHLTPLPLWVSPNQILRATPETIAMSWPMPVTDYVLFLVGGNGYSGNRGAFDFIEWGRSSGRMAAVELGYALIPVEPSQ